jgi:hypothetical protein
MIEAFRAVPPENSIQPKHLRILARPLHPPRLQRQLGGRRVRLERADRVFWVWILRLWSDWRSALVIVRPETVIRWHRDGFRVYWRWKSRPRRPGRPTISREIRELIRNMADANPTWGAPRIHGELLKLGIPVSESTVSKYLPRRRKPPSQGRRTYRVLSHYARYYNRSRTHLALAKDAPEPRAVRGSELGEVIALPEVGGLHHRYERRAA